MTSRRRPRWGRIGRRWAVVAAVALIVVAAGVVAAVLTGPAPIRSSSRFVTGTPEGTTPVRLDTSLFLPAHTPAPAVLLAHGFGGSKADLTGEATRLARHGYVVLTYTARGFGRSGGLVHLDSPDYEVADASRLIDYLATLPQVALDKPGDPRVAVAGSSYGGGLALLAAGYDHRVDAVGADITWNDLGHALFPNASGPDPGVFKKLWAGYLFAAGSGLSDLSPGGSSAGSLPTLSPGGPCGRFAPALCAAYQQAAQTGQPDAALSALLRASSPSSVLSRITAPTLLSQGEQDSLFPLSEADANARGIAANGTPVKVVWRSGGHDGGTVAADVEVPLTNWLDAHLRGKGSDSGGFTVGENGAALSASTGRRVAQHLQVAGGYPGAGGPAQPSRLIPVAGPAQTINAPAGGNPAAVTALPQLGGLLSSALGTVALNDDPLGGLSAIPGQVAAFVSEPLDQSFLLAGSSTVGLSVTARSSPDAVLFVALRDLAPDGSEVLPSSLVAPLRLTGLQPGVARTVSVQLPGVVRSISDGHRLVLTVSTTDLAYQLPTDPRAYQVAVAGPVRALTVTGTVVRPGNPYAWLIAGLVAVGLALLGGAFSVWRRRRSSRPDPTLVDVPIAVQDLAKEYPGGQRAVDGVSFRVERGQVVGLLGPNGAGKTTALRMLVGLIRPTSGQVLIFGEPVRPGAAVLARLGAFIEGPGLLPHLSGRDNLRLYWAATGRDPDEAEFDTALEIAGLGPSIDRRVKSYSQGMRQRLAIAQAMLGLPELLVLDEPTNGLDPPQIAEMREVLGRYAQTGRTVVISSHLLAEVEQTCTHVVVMHRGRLIAAGSVAEIAGTDELQLAVPDPGRAVAVLAAAGISAETVPGRRALEDVFLDLVGDGND